MDISKLQPTAEFKRSINGEAFILNVEYVGMDMLDNEIRETAKTKITEYMRDACFGAVTGWDFVDGDKPVPCDRENKGWLLPRFLMSVSDERKASDPKDASPILVELYLFINDADEFLKK